MALLSILDRSHTIAKPGFSRWMVPPAALCIHLCIGQALRVQRLQSANDQAHRHHEGCVPTTGSSPNLAGSSRSPSSSSVFPRPCSAAGSRKAARGAPCSPPRCASPAGFFVSAFGVSVHQLWIVYLGYGVLGGIGLGLGYISPVSTLIKWFPDRPGMATGMAIMGFGGGAMIASPLSVWLMSHFSTPDTCRGRRELCRAGAHLCCLHAGRRGDRARAGAGMEA